MILDHLCEHSLFIGFFIETLFILGSLFVLTPIFCLIVPYRPPCSTGNQRQLLVIIIIHKDIFPIKNKNQNGKKLYF